jgi:hypothetical protein
MYVVVAAALQGTNNSGHPTDDLDVATINQLPAMSTTMDTSTNSALSFTAQAATRYQEAKERHGLVPSSPAYDSDSDGGGNSSDDLYGEDLASMNLSGSSASNNRSSSFISP